MKRAGNLFEHVVDFHNLCAAARRAAKGKHGKRSAAWMLFHMETEVLELQRELNAGTYRPRAYRTFSVSDPKPRTISAAHIRDRVVHHALCDVLEPVFERVAIFDSYACRKGKGSHAAVRRVRHFSRSQPYFVKLDIRKFFETVDHGVLKALVRHVVKDPRVLWLVDLFIDHGAPGSPAGIGMPIGNLTSQNFANFYLHPLDHLIKEGMRVRGYVRYMDDMILFGHSSRALHRLRKRVEEFASEMLRLSVKDEATVVAPVTEGIGFLGMRIWPSVIRLDRVSRIRFIRKARDRMAEIDGCVGDEAEALRSLASLVGHVSQADTRGLRRSVFHGR